MSSNNTTIGYEEMIGKQVVCYGLPFGTFGFVCWTLSFISSLLLYCNFPLFSPWKWGKPYQSQTLLWAFISAALTIGPNIYTCVQCKGYWPLTVIAIGQLSPWSFKMFNDGMASMLISKINEGKINENPKSNTNRDIFYSIFGGILSCLLGTAGWVGMTALIIRLMHTSIVVSKWIWLVYLIPIVFVIIVKLCNGSGSVLLAVFLYFSSTTHIIGSHIILSEISGNWGGFPVAKGAL
ncbi:4977_t:CDS:2, partial [Scutellospora calospora]